MKNKKAAAAELGVSVRTLERYTRQGKISATYSSGRARRTPLYNEDELAALKGQLDRLPAPQAQRVDTVTETISFRMVPLYAQRLAAEGAKRGMSSGGFARTLVVAALEETEHLRLIREQVATVQRLVRLVGEDLANAVLVLLVQGGESEASAREWIRTHFQALALGDKG